MKLITKSTIGSLVLCGLFALPTHAIPVIQGADLANPGQSIDFSEIILADNTALGSQYSGLGVGFSGLYYNGCPDCITIAAKPDIGNFRDDDISIFNAATALLFQEDLEAATFRFAAEFAPFLVGAYLDGGLVESFNLDGSQWGTYGFSDSRFDEIRISALNPGLGAFLIDDLAFNAAPPAIPEPSTWALFGLALMWLSMKTLRNRKNSEAA